MKDPLAPENTYDHLNTSIDATPNEIEEAFDRFVENNPGKEVEATLMWNELRNPETRLLLDIFKYQVCSEIAPPDDFAFELPKIQSDDIAQLEQCLMNEIGKSIKFGAAKPILNLDICDSLEQ